jgi:hypothetical protein
MRKKWWLAIGLLLVLAVALGIGIPALWPTTPGVTYANFSRIEPGMTRSEVQAILGPPSMAVLRGDLAIDLRILEDGKQIPDSYYWQCEIGEQVQIHFDKNDRVTTMHWNGSLESRNAWEKLRDRLPWIAKKPPSPPVFVF